MCKSSLRRTGPNFPSHLTLQRPTFNSKLALPTFGTTTNQQITTRPFDEIATFAANSNLMAAATKLIINNNGSIKIEGDFEIVDKDGNAYGLQGRTIVSLCRCGRSANKPFCDGSHKEHFEHEAKAFDLPPKKV